MLFNRQADITLSWDYRDGRTSDYWVMIKVVSIKPAPKGFFGIKQSPSMLDWIPNATVLKGLVVSDDEALSGKSLTLTLSANEVEKVKAGDTLCLGIVHNEICIEFNKVED